MTSPSVADSPGLPYAEADGRAVSRQEQLASAVAGLRRRASLSLEQWMLLAGAILLPLGLLTVVLGWYGAAHHFRQYEQIPYLISGGLLGVAVVIAGGFLYFGYWLTRLVQEGRQQNQEVLRALEELVGNPPRQTRSGSASTDVWAPPSIVLGPPTAGEASPSDQVTPGGVATRPSRPPQLNGSSSQEATGAPFVATLTGSMFHRPDCPIVAKREELRQVGPDAAGFKPCRICEPVATTG